MGYQVHDDTEATDELSDKDASCGYSNISEWRYGCKFDGATRPRSTDCMMLAS